VIARTDDGRMASNRLVPLARLVPSPVPAVIQKATPIVKWAGGKTRLLPEILTRVPGSFVRYHEPFTGGGALFFKLRPASSVLSDTNAELMGCYRAVRDEVEAVIELLHAHRERHDEAYYYQIREEWNANRGAPGVATPERAAQLIYLNKTCYNGLWRVNSKGAFNVPAGRYENPSIVDAENLRAASAALATTELRIGGFEKVLDEARKGDFVYFDPPYHPVSDTAYFTSYTAERFGAEDQERLAATFRALDGRGCAVMLSNSDTPFIRKLYRGYQVETVMCARAINSRAGSRGAVAEVLVTNKY
jgi:DNA adenine methylase